MSLEAQIQLITVPQEFTRLCSAALAAEYGDDYLPMTTIGRIAEMTAT
ncbi:MAG TPA: hypothetical protein VLK89_07445 [Solirubrobacterales bacterium]|nr:hypothetical protein [Solirubrobacterales bacterium]